jgi:hypothetical protein
MTSEPTDLASTEQLVHEGEVTAALKALDRARRETVAVRDAERLRALVAWPIDSRRK